MIFKVDAYFRSYRYYINVCVASELCTVHNLCGTREATVMLKWNVMETMVWTACVDLQHGSEEHFMKKLWHFKVGVLGHEGGNGLPMLYIGQS